MALGWPIVADYKAWARVTDSVDDAAIAQCLAAAVDHLDAELTLLDADEAIGGDVRQAALLLTNRLLARRNSPEGVVGGADGTVTNIGRSDPDVWRLVAPYVAGKLA
jgi:hypothetical protein